ncbi:hypothetical protein AC249_AIPGENE12072 [Exaiptasia diaphana]|nr:hypothetical protein AC249_AIPGENE12072 [Exaiptasia diaphana]
MNTNQAVAVFAVLSLLILCTFSTTHARSSDGFLKDFLNNDEEDQLLKRQQRLRLPCGLTLRCGRRRRMRSRKGDSVPIPPEYSNSME